jgi:hypothetical protein
MPAFMRNLIENLLAEANDVRYDWDLDWQPQKNILKRAIIHLEKYTLVLYLVDCWSFIHAKLGTKEDIFWQLWKDDTITKRVAVLRMIPTNPTEAQLLYWQDKPEGYPIPKWVLFPLLDQIKHHISQEQREEILYKISRDWARTGPE